MHLNIRILRVILQAYILQQASWQTEVGGAERLRL